MSREDSLVLGAPSLKKGVKDHRKGQKIQLLVKDKKWTIHAGLIKLIEQV